MSGDDALVPLPRLGAALTFRLSRCVEQPLPLRTRSLHGTRIVIVVAVVVAVVIAAAAQRNERIIAIRRAFAGGCSSTCRPDIALLM